MEITSKWKRTWHRFWRNYHLVLLEGCLDENISRDLKRKITYHEHRLST
ncbi:hypothetical protein [Paenibacillus aceris]|uniref:Uncharacterized protein n=1 Tax=Paenibacillus aceris TaxID=869555 RepID=A0ABS4HUI5_9BACL|nr:hypothetical protein [Paenibacillus aceris]MBP1962296.1 hypothetical protein [Paenibacillus aceris]NHW37121.1 hypothetical protein [Paenibacillus aceris]